jgi:hypothetical protein
MMLDPSDAEAYEKYSDELVASGVVIAIPAGAATLYSLNSDHVAYPPIKQLSAMYDSVLEQIRDEIQGWSPAAVTVALFGSIARGDAADDSACANWLGRKSRCMSESSTAQSSAGTAS